MTKRTTDRPHKASIERSGRATYARLHLRDGSRPRVRIPSDLTGEDTRRFADAAQAEAWAKEMRRTPLEHEPARYIEAWLEERRAAGIKTTDDDRWLLGKHFLPHVEHRTSIVDVSRDDIEDLRDRLDEQIRAGTLAPKSAWNAWGKVKRLFDDLKNTKNRAMRIRTDDPTEGVRGPDYGESKEGQILFPSEFAAIVSCEAVPLEWRRLIAMAVYLGKRAGELRAITVGDVDLEHERIAVTKAWVRRSRSVGTPKTNTRKWVSIEPNLLPLVRRLVSEAGEQKDAPLFWMCREKDQPVGLRHWARVAGVSRPELFEETPTTVPLDFHDLRRTCATWMAAQGKSSDAIRARTGHQHLATLERYIKDWQHEAHAFGEPFPVLPVALVDSEFCPPARLRGSKLAESLRLLGGGAGNRIRTPSAILADSDCQSECESLETSENAAQSEQVDSNADSGRSRALLEGIAVCLRDARHGDAAQLARRLAALLEQLATVGAALALLSAGLAAPTPQDPYVSSGLAICVAQDPYVSSGLHGLSLPLLTFSRERSFRPFDSFARAKAGHRGGEGSPEGSPRSFGVQTPERGGHR